MIEAVYRYDYIRQVKERVGMVMEGSGDETLRLKIVALHQS